MPVYISYETQPSPSDWPKIKYDIQSQVPFRSLHWKSTARILRTINELHVEFRPLYSWQQNKPKHPLEKAFVNVMFVVSDDSELYKSTMRSKVREWLDSLEPNAEYLIVHVASKAAVAASSKFYQRKGTLVDRLKVDFRKDRVLQVVLPEAPLFSAAPSPLSDSSVVWAEFVSRLRDSIMVAFDLLVARHEDDLRRSDSMRNLPEWNFCLFFLQKEQLADIFDAFGLYSDALLVYDELEASFHAMRQNQRIHDTNAPSWNHAVGGTEQGDDDLPIPTPSSKPFRDLLGADTITTFDLMYYLFSHQALLLARMSRLDHIAQRTNRFLSQIDRLLRCNGTYTPGYLESMVHQFASKTAAWCDSLLQQSDWYHEDLAITAPSTKLFTLDDESPLASPNPLNSPNPLGSPNPLSSPNPLVSPNPLHSPNPLVSPSVGTSQEGPSTPGRDESLDDNTAQDTTLRDTSGQSFIKDPPFRNASLKNASRSDLAAGSPGARPQHVRHVSREISMASMPMSPQPRQRQPSIAHGARFIKYAYLIAKTELLILAHRQITRIGLMLNVIPDEYPFAVAHMRSTPGTLGEITAAPIRAIFDDKSLLSGIFLTLTHQTLRALHACGRQRHLVLMQATLAAFLKSTDPVQARRLMAPLPAIVSDTRWSSLEVLFLWASRDIYDETHDKDKLLATLALVRAGLHYGSTSWDLKQTLGSSTNAFLDALDESPPQDANDVNSALARGLMAQVRRLAQTLDKDFAAVAFPAFRISLTGEITNRLPEPVSSKEDLPGLWVRVQVENLLPCAIDAEDIRLKCTLVAPQSSYSDTNLIWFTRGPQAIPPGKSTAWLFSPTLTNGLIVLDLAQLCFSRIFFQYNHRIASVTNIAPDPLQTAPVVPLSSQKGLIQPRLGVPQDPISFDARFEIPRDAQLVPSEDDETGNAHLSLQKIDVVLWTGPVPIPKAAIRFALTSSQVSFDLEKARVSNGVSCTFSAEGSKPCIILTDLPPSTTLRVSVPFSNVENVSRLSAHVVCDLHFDSAKRVFKKLLSTSLALPFSIQMANYHREHLSVSKITLVSKSRLLRVQSIDLLSTSADLSIVPSSQFSPIVLDESDSATSLFDVRTQRAEIERSSGGDVPCIVRVSYVSLDKHIAQFANTATGGAPKSMFMLKSDTEARQIYNNLVNTLQHRNATSRASNTPVLDDFLHKYAPPHSQLSIPTTFPLVSLLCIVELSVKSESVRVGEPVYANLSLRMAHPEQVRAPVALSFSFVPASLQDWVIVGPNRALVTFSPDSLEASRSLTLVPLSAGACFLPSVIVHEKREVPRSVCVENLHSGSYVHVLPRVSKAVYVCGPSSQVAKISMD